MIVVDTNVLVSGLLNPQGVPGQMTAIVSEGVIELAYDARLLAEYHQVLPRPKFKLDPWRVQKLLEQIEAVGVRVAASPLPHRLPDRDDEMFLEVALAAEAECLVTGNVRHYPAHRRLGVRVVTPAEWVRLYHPRAPR